MTGSDLRFCWWIIIWVSIAKMVSIWPRDCGLATIVITANHEAAVKRASREAGLYYLLKPLKPLRLKMLLGTLLENHPPG